MHFCSSQSSWVFDRMSAIFDEGCGGTFPGKGRCGRHAKNSIKRPAPVDSVAGVIDYVLPVRSSRNVSPVSQHDQNVNGGNGDEGGRSTYWW